VQGQFASVLAADGGKVNVKLARPPDFDSSFVEFVGTVDAPNQITELDRTSFGNTFGAPSHQPPLAPPQHACGTLAVDSQQRAPACAHDYPRLCTSCSAGSMVFSCSNSLSSETHACGSLSTAWRVPTRARAADMNSYNELCKLAAADHSAVFI